MTYCAFVRAMQNYRMSVLRCRTGIAQCMGAQGGHVWREFWRDAREIDGLYAKDFDLADPVGTPAGINLENAEVQA